MNYGYSGKKQRGWEGVATANGCALFRVLRSLAGYLLLEEEDTRLIFCLNLTDSSGPGFYRLSGLRDLLQRGRVH